MNSMKGTFIFPHPPIIVREVGKGNEAKAQATIDGVKEAAKRIAVLKPDTIIIISPHGNLFADAITINNDPLLQGSFANFGAPEVQLELDNDLELVQEILNGAEKSDIMAIGIDKELRKTYRFEDGLDHGALVPLHFIYTIYQDFKLVHITYSMMQHEDHYRFGMAIREAIEKLNRNVVIICSGDLSHKLTKDAPAGYSPKGAEFDAEYLEIIRLGDVGRLLNMDCELSEAAGECGLRSTVLMYGILDGCTSRGEVLSYEGPFGVGYCVAELHLTCDIGKFGKAEVLQEYLSEKKRRLEEIRSNEDPYVSLARHTIESFIKTENLPELPDNLPVDMLQDKAGVFVSLKKHGDLRGCIGTIAPTTENIAREIVQNAISASTKDPRFYPIDVDELDELQYSVDVLGEPESIDGPDKLDVQRYGVIVRSGHKSGLLLPNLEGVDTIAQQLDIVLKKAGISKGENYKMERFEVIRHK